VTTLRQIVGLLSIILANGILQAAEWELRYSSLMLQGIAGIHLESAIPGLRSVEFEQKDLQVEFVEEAPASIVNETEGFTALYSWGHYRLSWKVDHGIAYGEMQLHNSTDRPISNFSVDLFIVEESGSDSVIRETEGYRSTTVDSPAFHSVRLTELYLTFGLRRPSPALALSFSQAADDTPGKWLCAVQGGVHEMRDGGLVMPLNGSARVAPGETITIPFLLKLSSADIGEALSGALFLSDLYKEANTNLNWSDRRPIGAVFLTEKHSESNPKGLFWNSDLDASNDDEVYAAAMEFAEGAVAALTSFNAQGAIFWDLEGTDISTISYVGDPRMLPLLNPQMDLVADAFFEVFARAGLKTGLTIRPSQTYFDEGREEWRHGTGSHAPHRNPLGDSFEAIWPEGLPWWRFFPIVERMSRKIAYARERWGCELFYIDSNGVYREQDEEGNFRWTLLNASLLRELRARHPDVLLIPELERSEAHGLHYGLWGTSAPYAELDMGVHGTEAAVRTVFKDAFSVINVNNGDIDGYWNELLESIRSGDIILVNGWFSNQSNRKVAELYRQANEP